VAQLHDRYDDDDDDKFGDMFRFTEPSSSQFLKKGLVKSASAHTCHQVYNVDYIYIYVVFLLSKLLYHCKHKGKRPLGRPRLRCVDNIRMDL